VGAMAYCVDKIAAQGVDVRQIAMHRHRSLQVAHRLGQGKDLPVRSHCRFKLPRPLQESGVIGKGGAAGFLGKAYDPYRLYQDPNKPIQLDDLTLRKEVSPERMKERFALLKGINGSMPDLEKALNGYAIDEYYGKAFDLVDRGREQDREAQLWRFARCPSH